MHKTILLLFFTSLFFPFLSAQTADKDLTEFVREQYAQLPAPKEDFRPGHVTVSKATAPLIQREKGFALQLPHQGLTPSPTFANGQLFVSGGFGSKEYFAFDAQTGALNWAVGLDDDGPTSAVVSDGKVVFNTESCTLFTLNETDGTVAWSYWLGDPLMSTPAVANGIVYTAYPAHGTGLSQSSNGIYQQHLQTPNDPTLNQGFPNTTSSWNPTHVLIALDLHSGKIRWQRWIDGDILSAPVVEGEELHFTTFPGTIYQFEANSGELTSARASRATSPPSIVGEAVFVSRRADEGQTVQESISQLQRSNGALVQSQYTRSAPYLDQQVQTRSLLKSKAMNYDAGNGFGNGAPANSGWQQAASNIGQSNVSSLQAFMGSRVLAYQERNFSVMGDELVCTDPVSGEVIWQKSFEGNLQQDGGYLATAPIVAGDQLLIATLKGDLVLYDPKKGKETARYALGETVRYPPIVHNGKIYVATLQGRVHCIDTEDPQLTGWPTLGGNAAHTNRRKN